MVVTKISARNTLEIPAEFRTCLSAGQEVAVTLDELGRMIVTPVEPFREALAQSFGAWKNRKVKEQDSRRFVRQIRKGHRLDSRD